jgi:hypothetical protein
MLLAKHLGISTSIEIPIEDRSYTYIAKIGWCGFTELEFLRLRRRRSCRKNAIVEQ